LKEIVEIVVVERRKVIMLRPKRISSPEEQPLLKMRIVDLKRSLMGQPTSLSASFSFTPFVVSWFSAAKQFGRSFMLFLAFSDAFV
jgi:hypothetical protein